MKNFLYILSVVSSLTFANELTTTQQITNTQIEIAKLQETLQKLQSSLAPQSKVKKQEELHPLKMHTEFGFVSTKGNTNTLSYSLDTKIQKDFGKHELVFLGDGQYSSDRDIETKNKYFLELDYGYQLSGDLYFEYITAYRFDGFSGFDYRAYTGPGLKYKAINEDEHVLNLSSALLLSSDKKESEVSPYNYTSYRAKIEYSRQIFKNLKFEETLTYRTDVTKVQDYFLYSKTAFISKLSDVFSVGLNYKIDYINMSEVGKRKADKTLSANLIADF